MNTLFSAEQIKIPQHLPDILKTFSKDVILNQPDDIYAYAAEYFEKLASGHQPDAEARWKPAEGIARTQLARLAKQLAANDAQKKGYLEREVVEKACKAVQFGDDIVQGVFRLGRFEDETTVEWERFIVLCFTLVSENLQGTIKLIFQIFGEKDSDLGSGIFLKYVKYLAAIDSSLNADVMGDLEAFLSMVVCLMIRYLSSKGSVYE